MRRRTRIIVIYLTLSILVYVIINSYLKTRIHRMFTTFAPKKSAVKSTNIRRFKKIKYILQWTSSRNTPFVYMGIGRKGFIHRNCSYTNCYVTSNRNHFLDLTKFDVIAFAGPEVVTYRKEELPKRRSPHQKYVFANIEAARNYPVCRKIFNGYFNWTWTYKLDSDLRWGYMVIKDKKGIVVGPNIIMNWTKPADMLPVSEELKIALKGKTKLAAWFVSNCISTSHRESYVSNLNLILKTKYNLSVDIYGTCGNLQCSRDNETKCFEMIRKDYHFYLSFENTMSDDYVTEKLLNAVQNNAIPVVFGGADYDRFLPEGSYLNSKLLSPQNLAKKMHQLMTNFDQYVEYFKWTNHYSYHRQSESAQTDEYCQMCELLNDEDKLKTVSIYEDLRKWWDPPDALCYGQFSNLHI